MSTDWYATVTGSKLEQGDFLRSCPIFRVEVLENEKRSDTEVIQEDHDVIVLTQTCDLENDKVQDVLVAVVLPYVALVERDGQAKPNINSSSFKKAAVEGNLPSYFLLPVRESPPAVEWSLVDFHNVFSVPKQLAARVAEDQGERLRLVPPYKEHLAQAFARYIMRVGLPTTLDGFKTFRIGNGALA